VEDVFGNRGRSDNVVVNQGRNVAQVGEQVATQQRLRGSSYSSQASHACGTCGVSRCRTRLPPKSSTSPSTIARGGRSAISLSETLQPTTPWATCALGAAARKSFMEPHSSDSTWPKVIHRRMDKDLAKARTHDSMQEVAKLTRLVGGRPRIISDPPLLVPIDELLPQHEDIATFESQLVGLIAKYRRTLETDRRFLLETFQYADMARKVVGVGSVGTRCWIILMLGRDESDPLFLQVKEAQTSVLSRFVGASKYTNQGQRVVAGQRLMQASSDIFLGWQQTEVGLDGQ
jgi:hypothetical protein